MSLNYSKKELELAKKFSKKKTLLVPEWEMVGNGNEDQDILTKIAEDIFNNPKNILNFKGREIYRVLSSVPYLFQDEENDEGRVFTHLELSNFRVIIAMNARKYALDELIENYKVIPIYGSIQFFTDALADRNKITVKKKKEIKKYIETNLHKDFDNVKIDITDWGEVCFTLDDSYFDVESELIEEAIRHSLDNYHWEFDDYEPPSNYLDYVLND